MRSSVHERSRSPKASGNGESRPAKTSDVVRIAWARSLLLYFVLAPLLALIPLVLVLLLRASGERAELSSRAHFHARSISSDFERETLAAAYLLKGLVESPARRAGDLPTFYEQLNRTASEDSTWFIQWDLEKQLLNTLRPLGAKLPAVVDYPRARATLERLRARDFAVSDRVTSHVNGAHLVAVHVKTSDDGGRMNGVLSVSLSESRLRGLISERSLPPGWVASLYDRALAHIASSGPDSLFGHGPPPQVNREYVQQYTGSFAGHDPEQPYRMFYHRSGTSGYTAVIRVPQAALNKPLNQAVRQIGLSGIALALASALAASLFSKRLSIPVQRLADTATKATDDLMFAEARHESFWTYTPESLFTVHVLGDGRFLFAGINPAHEKLTGIRSVDVAGREPHECVPGDVADAITARYRECIERGEPITYEEVLDLPGGRRSWRTSLAPVRDPITGEIVLLFGSARDVTDERRAHAELTRLNERLVSVLSSVSDCCCTLDRNYRLTAANPAALKWLALEEETAIGLSLKHVFSPDKPCGSAVIRALEGGEVVHEELPSVLRPGRWLSYHIYPSQDGVSLFFRDVTEARTSREVIREMSQQILASQEDERKRIASELHDSTAQHLVAAGLGLMQLPPPASEAEGRVRAEIDNCVSEALRELRVFTYLLHPPGLYRDGLIATLRRFVDGFGRRSGLCATLVASPSLDRLTEDLQRAVFRVVQEALANTHRHAQATRVTVRARLARGALFVRIRDDGHGMHGVEGRLGDFQDAPIGVGLPGMRARLKQFGGDLSIRSGATGTALVAMVPLMRDQAKLSRAA